MTEQFFHPDDNYQSHRFRIFDAFLVKYDATAAVSTETHRRRLPLHNDQSDYSLTIAMNGLNEYEGGGTYFCDLDTSLKTDIGGIEVFKENWYTLETPSQKENGILLCVSSSKKNKTKAMNNSRPLCCNTALHNLNFYGIIITVMPVFRMGL
eukprot:CAMPEP_0202444536 /NCGR_PEP_ID=MMETSP1360-20130828/3579_1 /ASSEMBLY_ACC=CAM_ASM_000848 /TAXON_ID=515479 /ORGANISM="Licmophora paradoxa, Strain CCMP2313" /LENGTH=151 /DNA_ID=CAMNT_0049060555 /DNA_START=156 /DNA_END=612 /DNA_ORIENTATION=-